MEFSCKVPTVQLLQSKLFCITLDSMSPVVRGGESAVKVTIPVDIILPIVHTVIRRRGHYNAPKLLTKMFPIRVEMLQLMNKMSAKMLNFWIG